ncbi:transcription antitermination factor NusB [Lactobacillus psittaci]|nr:transcription antitermination factor NusB [Lactobacillus psittaci]
MTQHDSRRIAMQAVFLANEEPDLTIEEVEARTAKSLDLKALPAYALEILTGVLNERGDLQALISKHLKKGWRFERINRISVAIMEVAIYEIKHSTVITPVAAVNEALILCEEFDDPKSKSFINGILANFMPTK